MRTLLKRLPSSDILTLSMLIAFLIVANILRMEFDWSLAYNDGWWYLNRAWLHSHGIFDSVSFYTLAYPLLIGAINWLVNDLPSAAIIANSAVIAALLSGTYALGRLLSGRATGILSACLLALHAHTATFSRLISADLLFTATVVWIIVAAVVLVREPTRLRAVTLAVLLAVAPFVRFEGVFHSLTLLAMLVAIYLRYRSWRILIRHIWEIAPIVSLAWLLYFAWFFSGADAIGNVPAKLSFFEKLERMLEVLGSQLSVTDWIIVGIGVVLLWAKMARHFAWLSLLVAFISLYIMLAAPELSARYAFQALPYLVTLYSAILVRAFQEFPLRIIAAAALVMYISQALLSLTPLPLPLAYREHPEAIRLKQAADELALWRQTSGYQNAIIYTLCIDLMIFAQFDIRMPFTTLSFSSQRFMPPDQALPRIAAQGGLFLSCPDFHSDLRADVTTAWQDFYRHLRHAESTNFGRCCVLERVGQVHIYTLYRVRLAASKL